MKAEELMIGNYLQYESQICEVTEIDYSGCKLLKPSRFIVRYDFDEISPIPLTEQWLIDFGFEKLETGFLKTDSFFSVFMDSDFYFWIGNDFRINIEHVYQLQNIYFALTGKQLTKQ